MSQLAKVAGEASLRGGFIGGGIRKSQATLERFLADRIDERPMHIEPERLNRVEGRSFGSRHLARTALQLYEPLGEATENLPRYAVVRWLERKGHSMRKIFGNNWG
ncbi:hypothetical protein GWG65_29625 [Bradyrhizobium sp. CSA207]|uniref:hypothetical protein n=1 Tax=Bradyrhizobium sp. CSA207 TaxID=2698826 RepID=UPI0023B16634|nr:hypothetical protein [Bradyrhizobium sp. CSA207]MDE5445514.1 hypothetical protein [Bradyrhizobium sp. CSA207]